jgi:hypothetical protein
MKKINFIATLATLSLVILFHTGCSTGGDTIFLPDLSAQWTNKADASNSFFFLVANSNVNSSTFDGNENIGGGGGQDNFTGSFKNSNITFTYTSTTLTVSKRGKSYSGTINNNSTVMTLSGSLGSLTLQKQ